MASLIKQRPIGIGIVIWWAKLTILLLAITFVVYYGKEFFLISSTGGLVDRLLLIPPLVFVLRASAVIFLAAAFGFLIMFLFKDIERFKAGSIDVLFSKGVSERAAAQIRELEKANEKLSKKVEELSEERDTLQVILKKETTK